MVVQGVKQVDAAMVKAYAQDLRNLLEESGFTQRKAFLRSFIKRIEIDKSQAVVRYNLPVPYGEGTRAVGVLPIVTPGGAEGTLLHNPKSRPFSNFR